MLAPVYSSCADDAAVQTTLGNPPRIYPFGDAPPDEPTPYLIWQTISGTPENVLAGAPDSDGYRVQIDIYGQGQGEVLSAAKAVRDALEKVGYVESWNGEGRDRETKEYFYSFDVSFLQLR